MANVNFNLKDSQSSRSLIFLMFNYNGNRVKLSTGMSIPTKYWNLRTRRIRETVDYMDHQWMNRRLNEQADLIDKLYRGYIQKGEIPTSQDLKNSFLEASENPSKLKDQKTFWDYFEDFVEFKRVQLSDVRDYDKALRKHLTAAENLHKRKLTFNEVAKIAGGFVDTFEHYLTYTAVNSRGEKGLTTNTVGKQNKNLKVFLNWCFDNGHVNRFGIKHIVTKSEQTDSVYLTEKELKSLLKLKITDPIERRVRDLFVISCESGLRFGDVINLSQDNFQGNNLSVVPEKTRTSKKNNRLLIPISDRVKKVMQSNESLFESSIDLTNTEFNRILRGQCKNAKINQTCYAHRSIAGKEIVEKKPKFELISSHSGRRTFCTLKFLSGMPAQAIMAFSGHSTERSFLKYLKLDSELVAKQYRDFF